MELTVIGAGPAYTDRPGALGSAYLVQAAGASIVLDFGHGILPSLFAMIEPSRLDGIVISHLHPDHLIDLVPLRHYLCYEFKPSRRMTVHAPEGLDQRLDALHASDGFFDASLDLEPLRPGLRTIGPLSIETIRVTHTADSHAVRVTVSGEDGPGLVYSGDCGAAMDLAPLVRPGDTLLTEVSFGPGPVPVDELHLDGQAIGQLAAATRPGRVLLTHLQMGYDADETIAAVNEGWDGEVRFVWPGDRLTV
ncbi:MAG TPA: MBL fold metallo-hydrolase [Candidatus Limnocylindrales bacterium]|nr:MBL fold metallo-hydrolase [Candidatus Limnocylindrales bacterium]